jgi:hypothetical protein
VENRVTHPIFHPILDPIFLNRHFRVRTHPILDPIFTKTPAEKKTGHNLLRM